VVVDSMTEAIDLREILGKLEEGIFLVKVGDDFVDGGRDLLKEVMVDELDKVIERELQNNISRKNNDENDEAEDVLCS
jgi:hypothetical protein